MNTLKAKVPQIVKTSAGLRFLRSIVLFFIAPHKVFLYNEEAKSVWEASTVDYAYDQERKALLQRIETLEKENAGLRAELCLLKGIPAVIYEKDVPKPDPVVPMINNAAITRYSSSVDKIALFKSLFHGREDVYAKRWESLKTKKHGYSPACANEWKPGICRKPCGKCENRDCLPLNDHVLNKHLSGKDPYCQDVVGIYPILQDDKCWFLAIDFDDGDWQSNVSQVRSISESWDIPCYVERSRSGQGAHIWFFFEEPILCYDARRIGTALLTAAMEKGGTLSLSSYDRMFPNQDSLPKGGFGNLIALPLQGNARKNHNSEFVDEAYNAYPDQWAFLSSVQRLSPEKIEYIIQHHVQGDALGTVIRGDDSPKPWEQKKAVSLQNTDFPINLTIIKSNLLYVEEGSLSLRAKNRLVRLAAFKNPDFYRSQAMRLPIYNKPRIINTAECRGGYLALPRGCENELITLLEEAGVPYYVDDKRNPGQSIQAAFSGVLREEQKPAAEALAQHDTGVLAATTAFGKTVIAAWLIGQKKVNTLVLVHTKALLNQWVNSLGEFLEISEELPMEPKSRGRRKKRSLIGQIGSGKRNMSGIVDVAILQSLLSGDEVDTLVRNYGMVIVDECHHVSAVNFERVLKEVTAKYVYGLSATPTRQDGHQPVVFLQCGPIRYTVDAKEQAEKREFEHFIVPRFTSFRCATAEEQGIAKLYSVLGKDDIRNAQVCGDVRTALLQGRCPIVLTERREHVDVLAEQLSGSCDNIIKLYGTVSEKDRRLTLERLKAIPADQPILLIATGKYVGEGFDYPRLDTLFLAMPISWKGKVAQYAGRLHRNFPGKEEVLIYDYVDIHVPVLEKMYQKRLKGYASIGYHIRADSDCQPEADLIYDGKSFYPVYCQDLKSAKNEILIVSPFMKIRRLNSLVTFLSEAILNKATVKVVTRPPEEYREKDQAGVIACTEYLKGYGITVSYRSGFHQKFTIIDQRITWYGSVNFLSFGSAEESIMRLESFGIAGQLTDTLA